MNKRKWLGSGLLLITAIVWGFCFVVQRTGMDYVGPFTYGASRFLLGGAALLPLALPRRTDKQTRRSSALAGVPCGVLLFAGTSLQQAGLMTVSAGKAGFLTAMYIVLVPLLGLFLGQKPRARVWISAVLGAVGLYLLCVGEDGASGMHTGDWLLIACALMFALHIQLVDHVAEKTDSLTLSCSQYLTVAALSLIAMLLTETPTWTGIRECLPMILYGGLVSIAIGYTLQVVAQKITPPAVASVMMCLESVFATLSGWLVLGEMFSAREGIGAVVMLCAALLAQL